MRRRSGSRLLAGMVCTTVVVAAGIGLRSAAQGAPLADDPPIKIDQRTLARAEELSRAFRRVADVAKPGVVHVRVEGDEEIAARLRRELKGHFPDRTDEEISKLVERRMRYRTGSGSGIVLDSRGNILTNNHVVENRTEIRVVTSDGRELPATVVGADSRSDIAVIHVEADDLPPLKFADDSKLNIGDWVIAIGSPFGLADSVSHGIVAAKQRSIGPYDGLIQSDAAINPGNSGGPLLNLRGEVVGVNTAIAALHDEDEDGPRPTIAFSIPASTARKMAAQLIEHGKIVRGWLGVSLSDLSREDSRALGARGKGGALVEAVIDDTPAARAGLEPDDIIVGVNGDTTRDMAHARALIADVSPGETAKLEIVRDGEKRKLEVELGTQPAGRVRPGSQRVARHVESLGLDLTLLRPSIAKDVGLSTSQRGLIVVAVRRGNEDKALNPERDIIVECNGRRVTNVADLKRVLEKARGEDVKLRVIDLNGEGRDVTWPRQ